MCRVNVGAKEGTLVNNSIKGKEAAGHTKDIGENGNTY